MCHRNHFGFSGQPLANAERQLELRIYLLKTTRSDVRVAGNHPTNGKTATDIRRVEHTDSQMIASFFSKLFCFLNFTVMVYFVQKKIVCMEEFQLGSPLLNFFFIFPVPSFFVLSFNSSPIALFTPVSVKPVTI
jgi:hypothetical protein